MAFLTKETVKELDDKFFKKIVVYSFETIELLVNEWKRRNPCVEEEWENESLESSFQELRDAITEKITSAR